MTSPATEAPPRPLVDQPAPNHIGDVWTAVAVQPPPLPEPIQLGAAITSGIERQPGACLVGLLAGWTGLFVAVWLAAVFAIAGGIVGMLGLGSSASGVGQAAQTLQVVGFIGGAAAGFGVGFVAVYGVSIAAAPLQLLLSLLVGFVSAMFITALALGFESISLDLRSYRRPSRRADEARLLPMLADVGRSLGLNKLPQLRISDEPIAAAWAHPRTIVVTKGLITQMDSDEIAAVLAHELHHWQAADPIALRFAWACALPIIIFDNLCRWCLTRKRGWASFMVIFLWPAIVLTRYFVAPLLTTRMRTQEFEADAAAIAAGYGPALGRALSKIQCFEVARTGWEAAILRTHPPTEFRLEAIEEASATPA
jgi:Zn-dependent protease with chaperone function